MIRASLIRIKWVETRMIFVLTFCIKVTSVQIVLLIFEHVTLTAGRFCWRLYVGVKSRSVRIRFIPKCSMSIWDNRCSLSHNFLEVFRSLSREIVLRSVNSCFFFPLDLVWLNIISSKSLHNLFQFIPIPCNLIVFSFVCQSIIFLKEVCSESHSWEIEKRDVFRN